MTKYFENDSVFGQEFKVFFQNIGIEPQVYFPLIFSHVIPASKKGEDEIMNFKPENKFFRKVLEHLSNNEIVNSNFPEVLNLKRNPVYSWDKEKDLWLLLDLPFLVDYCFYYTINSFWFSHLKPKSYSHKVYFGKVGNFYESYITNILSMSFCF